MRTLLAAALLCFIPTAGAGEFTDSSGRSFLPQSPGVLGGSAGAFVNPAAWAMQDRTELAFYWTDEDLRPQSMDNWGVSLGRNLGFAAQQVTGPGALRSHRYQLGTAFGTRAHTGGVAWSWSTGDDAVRAPNGVALGSMHRPNPHVSWSLSGFLKGLTDPEWGVVDVGLRPWAKPWVTVFADYAVGPRDTWTGGRVGGGVALRPLEGIELGYRLWDGGGDRVHGAVHLGVTLSDLGLHAQPQLREREHDTEHAYTGYLVRVNPPHAGLPAREAMASLGNREHAGVIDLEKRVITYDRGTLFEPQRKNWLELSGQLRAAAENRAMTAVAINLSGAAMRPSLGWELREWILRLRAQGKTVYVHSDNFTMGKYYVASAADSISMDPLGILRLPGLAFHRTYWKGFLEKLGIGSQEWRLFTHKTMFQRYVREDMSEADREQLGRLADVIYELWRDGICRERGLTHDAFDALVDGEAIFTTTMARERSLVDYRGTWSELRRKLVGRDLVWTGVRPAPPGNPARPGDYWGALPEIAVVYAVGACAMDSGIQGRRTAKHIEALSHKANLAGLVLRVDSPGGDPLPCEVVNRAVKRVGEGGRPVLVSQGDVAASGGYLLSVPADTILATPMTVTGSIGVIFGWLWDDGFSEKSGFTADGIQRGAHADLLTGIKLPFVPVRLPGRNLTPEELETAEALIAHEYDMFVGTVAEERGLPEDQVRAAAEGRVWMAQDALERGLVDGLGGLEQAIDVARAKAGIGEDDPYTVSQYPQSPFLTLPRFSPRLNLLLGGRFSEPTPAPTAEADYETEYLKLLFAEPGRPMYLLHPSMVPVGW